MWVWRSPWVCRLAVVAAIVPALEASRLSPVATVRSERELAIPGALAQVVPDRVDGALHRGGLGRTRPPIGGLPVFGVLAALAVVLAAALLAPPALYVLQRFRGPRGGWLHVEGALARTNLGGAIRRLAISVAALAVSLAMMVAIAIMIGSFRETVVYWVGQTLQADLFVTAARQSPVGERATISTEIEEAITGHPAFVAIDAFRGIDVTYEDSLVIVGSGRFDVMREHGDLLFKTPSDERDALARAVREAGVVVSESFSLKFDKTAGDTIQLPTARGPTVFPVVGVYYDYSSDRGLVVMDEALFTQHYDDRRPSGLMVYLAETADPAAVRGEVLAALGPGRAVFINTNAMLRGQALQVFDSTFAITYALEAIAIFVSMFGVAATLLTLTLERRQQIAMLRLSRCGAQAPATDDHDRGHVTRGRESGNRSGGRARVVAHPDLRDQRAELWMDDPVSPAGPVPGRSLLLILAGTTLAGSIRLGWRGGFRWVICRPRHEAVRRHLFVLSLVGVLVLPGSLRTQEEPDGAWRRAAPGYVLEFPRDHASHPEYRVEWWYYTGNLDAVDGRRFGYQVTFFRVGIDPQPTNPSRGPCATLYGASGDHGHPEWASPGRRASQSVRCRVGWGPDRHAVGLERGVDGRFGRDDARASRDERRP